MQNERNILPLTELDKTVGGILPNRRRSADNFYLLLITLALLLSVFSVVAFYNDARRGSWERFVRERLPPFSGKI